MAADAGVAVQTVYFTFRSKGDLLQAADGHVVLGPERIPLHLSAWWRAVETEPDIAAAIRGLVEGTLDVLDRAAPLVWAAGNIRHRIKAGGRQVPDLTRQGTGIPGHHACGAHQVGLGGTTAHCHDVGVASCCQLDQCQSDASGSAGDEHCLPGQYPGALEHAHGRAVRDWQAGELLV